MATTINSGYANSPKLTANIADHADVYGGRALVFDGVTDYLDCGTGLGNQLGNNYAGSITTSFWFKTDVTNSDDGLFYIGNFTGSEGEWSVSIIGNRLDWKLNNNGWKIRIDPFTSTDWNHLACVYSAENQPNSKMYLNGESVGIASGTFPSASDGNFDIDLSGLKTIIGAYYGNIYVFDGKMADVKIFDSALTEAQVQELYKKPENTPSAVQDNLVAWYPMIEGNPDSPQSIVYDHSEKKLGSDVVVNGSFDTDSNWSKGTGWTISDGKARCDGTQTGNTNLQTSVAPLTSGKLYKVTFDLTRSAGNFRFLIGSSGSSDYYTTDGTHTFYKVENGNDHVYAQGDSNFVGTLNNVIIKEVLMGNHATTNFFGNEIVNDPSFDTALANGQTNANFKLSGDGSITGGAFAFTAGSGVGRITIMDNASTETTFSNTKTYQVQFTISSSGNALLNFDWANGGYVNYGNGSHTLTAVGDSGNLQIQASPSGNDFSMTDISIKEVGISSSGFETSVNEPVVPQVPLMKYNQKMHFDGVDDRLNPSAPDLLVSGDWSISAWFVTDSISADQFIMAQTQSANNRIGIHINTSGNIVATMWDGSSYYQKSSTAISVGTMNHVVYANSNKTITLYLNGVAQSGSLSEGVESATGTTIGCKTGNSMFFNGIIEDMSFFNHTMTSTEAQELFNDGVALDATTHSKSANLIGYWRNDGVTTWKDRSTNSNDGDVQGTPDSITIREGLNANRDALGFYFTNPSSNVIRFKREHNEYLNLGVFDDNTWKGSFTISCWLKLNDGIIGTSAQQIMGTDDGSGDDSRIFLSVHYTGTVRLLLESEGTSKVLQSNNAIFADGASDWKHITMVVNRDTNNGHVYIDDSEVASTGSGLFSGFDTSTLSIQTDFHIGAENRGSNTGIDGLLDEVRIYNKALSASEVIKNYKHQKGKHKND